MSPIPKEITQKKAIDIYKDYVKLLHDLIFVNKNKFDLIVGPADSGVFMAKTVEMLYEIKGVPSPRILIMPIQRYEDPCKDSGTPFDNLINSDCINQVKIELANIPVITNILFVDDEISSEALTAKGVLKLLLSIGDKVQLNDLVYTIIAENHGFQWKYNIPSDANFPPIPIRYYAYGNKIRWRDESNLEIEYHANGTVFSVMSDEIFAKYKNFPLNCKNKKFSKKHLASLFTYGKIKASKNNAPYLTNDLLEMIKKEVSSFSHDQQEFLHQISELIRDTIK